MLPVLKLENIYKYYSEKGEADQSILKNISLELQQGTVTALVGASGSGKSTLLNIAGLLDVPSSGSVQIAGLETNNLTDFKKSIVRRNNIGFIFQFHHLLADFTLLENVIMPALINQVSAEEAQNTAAELLKDVGLVGKENRYPNELSGGERQRCAVARALINRPRLLLADEPTGNLDSMLSYAVADLIIELVERYNSSAIVVTHDMNIASKFKQQIHIKDGSLLTNI